MATRSAPSPPPHRSALAAVLLAALPGREWAPNFICGAVDETLRAIGADVRRYALDASLGVPEPSDRAGQHR